MKKSLQILASAALFAASTLTASADRYWEAMNQVSAGEIEAGVNYVLNDASHSSVEAYAYLTGTSFHYTANIPTTSFVRFEAAGDDTWYILNSEGEYLQDPEFGIGYTVNPDKRWVVTVKDATYVTDLEEAQDNEFPLNEVTSTTEEVEGVVIASATAKADGTYTYLQGFTEAGKNAVSGNATYGSDLNKNLWVIETVHQMDGVTYWETVVEELFGEDGFDADNYSTGKNPGDYSEEALEALQEAYDAGSAASTDDEAEAAAEALKEAYETFKASFVNFGPGFYIFTTYRSAQGAMFDNTGNVAGVTKTGAGGLYTLTDPAIAITHTQNGTQYSIGDFDTYQPEDVDPENEWMNTAVAPYIIWEVIETDEPGLFYVKNRKTGRYIGTPGADQPSNKPIPTVAEPNARFNMAPSTSYHGYWKFYSPELTKKSAWGGGWEMGGLHAPGDVLNMVTWDSETDGSLWFPRTVTPEMLEIIDKLGEQPALNMELKKLVTEAESLIEDSKVYSIFDLNTGLPAENLNVFETLDVDGLVTEVDQISSNSIHEGDGDGLDGLLDSDCNTFYHSGWNDDYAPKSTVEVEDPETGDITEEEVYDKHYLQFDLRDSYKDITVKFLTRGNGNVQGRLNKVTVYASKDGENFEAITEGEFHYTAFNNDNKVTVAGETQNCWVGVASFDLGAAYQYVRVEHTTPAHTQSIPWMNASEIRVYEGLLYEYKYDEGNSPYESVPQQYRDELDKQLETAKAELEDELATKETIDALAAAIDAFKAHKPDPEALQTLINNAKAIIAAAEVADAPGYFSQNAVDTLQAAIDAIGVPSAMTVEELAAAMEALNAAIDAFNASIIMPANGWYMIKSMSDEKNNNGNHGAALYAQNSAYNHYVKLGGIVSKKETSVDEEGNETTKTVYEKDNDFAATVGAYWYVENVQGGLTFKNLYTGQYLAPVKEKAIVAQSAEPYVFSVQFAKVAGCFNFVINEEDAAAEGKYIFVNAQPQTYNLVTWGSADGADNSAFAFEPYTEEDINSVFGDTWGRFTYYPESKTKMQIATFPVDIDAADCASYFTFYNVLGQDENHNIVLEKTTEVKAGYAYIMEPVSEENTKFELTLVDTEIANMNPTHETKETVGICPVWDLTVVPAGNGYFNSARDKAITSDGKDNETVAPNSGFFVEMPATTAAGDAKIAASGSFLPNGIANIITNNDMAKGIYNLSGVRINSIKNLPAGLYIINGKKYIVK